MSSSTSKPWYHDALKQKTRYFRGLNNVFGITTEHYPELSLRTNALAMLYIALAYGLTWFSYIFIYRWVFESFAMSMLCLCFGLPSSLLALYILKSKRNPELSSIILHTGGVSVVFCLAMLSGGAWSQQFLWCMVGVGTTFLVQPIPSGMAYCLYVSLGSFLIAWFIHPRTEDSFSWSFTFPFLGTTHAVFHAITVVTAPLLLGACASIFKIRYQGALTDSERLRNEAEQAKERAQSLSLRVQEQTREIKSILETVKVGICLINKDLTLHHHYAHYLETLCEAHHLGAMPFADLILEPSDLTAKEKTDTLNLLTSLLQGDLALFEAHAGTLPTKCLWKGPQLSTKALDLAWAPMINQQGQVEKILLSLTDISEVLGQKEAQLRNEQTISEQNLRFSLEKEILKEREISEKTQRFEAEIRLNMAASIAHRLNNPLNFITLGVDSVASSTLDIRRAVDALIGSEPSPDPEVLACQESFLQLWKQLDAPLSEMRSGIQRSGSLVNEIRTLSGSGGTVITEFDSFAFLNVVEHRLQENLSSELFTRLHFDFGIHSPTLRGCQAALMSAIETFYSVSLSLCSGDLRSFLSIVTSTQLDLELESQFAEDDTMFKALERCLQNIFKNSGGRLALALQGNRLHLKLSLMELS